MMKGIMSVQILLALMVFVANGCATVEHRSHATGAQAIDSIDATVALRSGVELLHRGQPEQAQSFLEAAVAADPNSSVARNNLGVALYQQRRFYEAAAQFQKATRLLPHQIAPRNNLGLVLEAVGDLEGAVEQYESSLRIDPSANEPMRNLARAMVRRGDHSRSLRDMLMTIASIADYPIWQEWARSMLDREQMRYDDGT